MPDDPDSTLVPQRPPATAGAMRLRVRYCECDPMGVAHHASYLPWLEIARTELLRITGVSYADLERAGVFLVIAKLEVRYRRPIRYDDVVELRTRVVGNSRVKISHEYDILIAERDGREVASPEIVAAASTTLACVGRDGRPMGLPPWLAGDAQQSGIEHSQV